MKKILMTLLALCAVLMVAPGSASAEVSTDAGSFSPAGYGPLRFFNQPERALDGKDGWCTLNSGLGGKETACTVDVTHRPGDLVVFHLGDRTKIAANGRWAYAQAQTPGQAPYCLPGWVNFKTPYHANNNSYFCAFWSNVDNSSVTRVTTWKSVSFKR